MEQPQLVQPQYVSQPQIYAAPQPQYQPTNSCMNGLKIALIVINILILIGGGIVLIILFSSFGYYTSCNYDYNSRSLCDGIYTVIIVIIIIMALTLTFVSMGLYGALKEHYCTTLTYGIFMTITAIVSIWPTTMETVFVVPLLIDGGVAVMAFFFANEIKKKQLNTPAGVTMFTAPQMVYATPQPQAYIIQQPQYPQQVAAYSGGAMYAQGPSHNVVHMGVPPQYTEPKEQDFSKVQMAQDSQ